MVYAVCLSIYLWINFNAGMENYYIHYKVRAEITYLLSNFMSHFTAGHAVIKVNPCELKWPTVSYTSCYRNMFR